MKPRLLILSASTGNGHTSAALAIEEEAKSRGLHAVAVDVLDHVPKGFKTWYRGGYEQLVRKKPKAWGHLYRSTDRPLFNYQFQTGLDWSFCRNLKELILETRPDWVVCTHSLPQPRLATIRRSLPFRMSVVVTDLYVHRMWLRGRPDFYFLPQPWSKQVLARRRPHLARRSDVTGIPIHPAFTTARSQQESRAILGLSEGPTALVSSGGIGGGPLADAVASLIGAGVRVVAVAGRNNKVEQDLTEQFKTELMVRVLGHVSQDEMASLMSAADVLVGKPGGLTTFEALATGLPFVVFWPFLIPGQEEGNAEFLAESGSGIIIRSQDELGDSVGELIQDKSRLGKMAESAKKQSQPDAAKLIVTRLCDL